MLPAGAELSSRRNRPSDIGDFLDESSEDEVVAFFYGKNFSYNDSHLLYEKQ